MNIPACIGSEAWTQQIPPDQRQIYRRVLEAVRSEGISCALGGGFAVAAYTGRCRNFKDLDLYVLPRDKESMIAVVTRAGLGDYYGRVPYDRRWIYRATTDDVIVDVIWSMANHRAEVDEVWLSGQRKVEIEGERLPVLPMEEMLWDKLYVLQRDRCDWPDVLNLLYVGAADLDWRHLLDRMGEDTPLLGAALSIFEWLCPGRAEEIPSWLWGRLELPARPPARPVQTERHRVDLLDRRDWFRGFQGGSDSGC